MAAVSFAPQHAPAAGSGSVAARANTAAKSAEPTLGMEDIFEAFMLLHDTQSSAHQQQLAAATQWTATPAPPALALSAGHGHSVTLSQAIDVWSAVCQMAEEAILRRQSLVIPGFASVGLQTEAEGMGGLWRDRLSFAPCLHLTPVFVSQYCSDRAGYRVANPQKVGGAVPVLLNGATLSAYANGIPRHIAVSILKDLIRVIGKLLLEGGGGNRKRAAPLRVEMGFATLDFTAPALKVRWARRFMEELAETIEEADRIGAFAGSANNTDSTSPRRPHTAPRIPAPPGHQRNAPVSVAPFPASASGRAVPAPPPASAKRPADGAAAMGGRGRINGAAAPQQQRPDSARASPTPSIPSRSNSVCSVRSASSAASQQSPRGARPRTAADAFSGSSPRNRELFEATLDAITRSNASAYAKGKARKAAYRRMRGAAFQESWGAQIEQQREKEAAEREEERQRVDHFRRSLAEQAAKEHNERLSRRREGQQVQELNKALAARRDEVLLPRRVSEPGDLFSSRNPPTRRDGNEAQILLHQMAEKKERAAKERAADRVFHEYLAEQDAAWNDGLRSARAQRIQQQAALREEYLQQFEQKKAEEARFKATMPKAGSFFYSEGDSAADEHRERREVKLRTRGFQQENKRRVEEKEHEQRIATAERDLYNRAYRRQQDELARQRAEEERQTLRCRQNDLGATLRQQAEEKKRQEAKAKAEHDNFKPFSYLRNESSDDDE